MTDFHACVEEAEQAIRALFPQTPLQLNEHLSKAYGARIYLKREDLTPVRSYKIRGAFNYMRKRLAQGGAPSRQGDGKVEGQGGGKGDGQGGGKSTQFCAASAGNHAQGFAFACRHFGVTGRIFMPVTTPQQKIDKTRVFGGAAVEIELVGDFFDDCYAAAKAYAAASGAEMVPPFDHEDIVEGQATVALEIERQLGSVRPDLIVMPIGGGGLASGITRYFDGGFNGGATAPDYRFVEPAGAPSLRTSIEGQHRTRLPQIDGFVDGAAVAEIGALPFEILRRFPPEKVVLAPEDRLCGTMLEMLNVEGIVLEPAGALAVDALHDLKAGIAGKTLVLVISGGNFDFERLPDVKERALRFDGRKKYFILRLAQRPGALRDFLALLGPHDDISRFEYLKKSARDFGSILLGIETSDAANFVTLLQRFDVAGIRYQDITDNEIIADLLI